MAGGCQRQDCHGDQEEILAHSDSDASRGRFGPARPQVTSAARGGEGLKRARKGSILIKGTGYGGREPSVVRMKKGLLFPMEVNRHGSIRGASALDRKRSENGRR